MDRRKIEHITASIAVLLLFLMTIGLILFSADQFFQWNLFPQEIEKVIFFLLIAGGIVIISAVMVNIMINMSIMAINSEILSERLSAHEHGKPIKNA